MKKDKLKLLIKTILKEHYKRTLNESSSGTLEDYEIELENLVIPNVTINTDVIIVVINLEYETSGGHAETGQFGPPGHAMQAEDEEIDIRDYDIITIKITAENGKSVEIEPAVFELEQLKMIKHRVNDYLDKNEDSIKQMILNK